MRLFCDMFVIHIISRYVVVMICTVVYYRDSLPAGQDINQLDTYNKLIGV